MRRWQNSRLLISWIWPRLEHELDRERGILENSDHRVERVGAFGIERRVGDLVADLDQAPVEPRPQHAVVGKDRVLIGQGLVGRVLALPVPVERPIQARQQLGMAPQHFVMDGVEADRLADAALARRP